MRISDWSSDVCSSDLIIDPRHRRAVKKAAPVGLRCGSLLGDQAAEQGLDGGKAPSARLANTVANLGGGHRAVLPKSLHHRMLSFAYAFGLTVFAVCHGHLQIGRAHV